jgi:transcriptional regulator with GAF, ATPase, and Fis domain
MDELTRAFELRPQDPGDPARVELLGHSPMMVRVRELIALVADTDATVLIRGESGTGKELVARSLRASSSRVNKPFVKVNCAALPSDLLESEMFGFERGAFSGALHAKPGKFEFANHGTIFLDEIGEMPPSLQAKILHVLQDGQFSRLGGQSDVRVDVRIVAATNRRLEEDVAGGRFREDLFFRLNVVCISMPPLRERREEIPALVRLFLQKYATRYNRPPLELPPATLDAFMRYDWPGNVRELENVIQRVIILGPDPSGWSALLPRTGERRSAVRERRQNWNAPPAVSSSTGPVTAVLAVEASPPPASPPDSPPDSADSGDGQSLKLVGRNAARAAEREMMLRMLNRTRWNRKEAAGILGISYKALLYKIKEHRLDDPLTDPIPEPSARG